mmetsp:Transcript_7894/g.12074  ORF Transcript_7894/g.12074 Transcript_7894/m.12074 type:complete len:87 (+) Transcript_7894:916-1176(+)
MLSQTSCTVSVMRPGLKQEASAIKSQESKQPISGLQEQLPFKQSEHSVATEQSSGQTLDPHPTISQPPVLQYGLGCGDPKLSSAYH